MTVRAVTFDFWNTLFAEVAGTISEERALLLCDALRPRQQIAVEDAVAAIDRAWQVHRERWHAGRHYATEEAARLIAADFLLPEADDVLEAIEGALGYMYPPDRLRMCDELTPLLHQLVSLGLRLGIVSDTGFSPGRVLWQRLEALGLATYFVGGSFSDEVGSVKPDPSIFHHSLSYLRSQASETIHVGDLWRNDVCGARAAGFRTVRYMRWNDDPPAGVDADFVSASHSDTLTWVRSLVAGSL